MAGIPVTAVGQSDSTAKPNRKVDYGPAIDELLKLGFPNLTDSEGAKYVKLNDSNLEWTCSGFGFSRHNGGPTLTGNGFHIPSKDETKPDRFIYLGGCEIPYITSKIKPSIKHTAQNSTRGSMVDADLLKDLKSMQQWAKTSALSDDFRYNAGSTFSVALGFAAVAHQAGHEKEATDLIKTLFLSHEDPEKVLSTLINNLANREYTQVYQEFNLSKDWSKYHASLIRLQKKYPRGWKNQPGLEILIPQVLNRVNNAPALTPSIKGHTFSPGIKKLIDATAQPTKSTREYYGNNHLFVIDVPAKNTSAPPFNQLTQHGMDGFIAIVSLIGDETLVPGGDNNDGMNYSSYSSYGDDETSPEEAYKSLTKPSTRGGKAYSMINSTLPHGYQILAQMEPDQLKAFAINWWQEHRNDTKAELIKHYLAEGNQSHSRTLIQSMLTQNTDESRQLLEKSILTSEQPGNYAETVKSYVKKRKSKAKDFLAKYKAAIVNESKNSDSLNYNIRNAGGIDKYIASMMSYTEEIDPTKLLVKLANEDANSQQIMELLVVAYEGQKLSEYINPIILIAAKKEKPTDQLSILTALLESSYREGNKQSSGSILGALKGYMGSKRKNKTEVTKKFTFSDAEKAAWETLLYSENNYRNIKISSMAGMLLDKYAHPSRSRFKYDSLQILGPEVIDEMVRSRSKAILAGTELTPLPDPDSVKAERVTEILKSLNEAEPAKLRQSYLALNHSEKMKLANNTEMRTIFIKGQEFIQGVETAGAAYAPKNLKELKPLLQPLMGKKKDTDTYLLLAKTLLENADGFAGLSVVISPSRSLPGLDLMIYNQTTGISEEVKSAQKDLLADKIASFSAITVHDRQTNESSSQIFTKTTQPTAEKLKAFSAQDNLVFTAFTKPALQKIMEEQKASKGDREQLIKEIIELQPHLEEFRDKLDEIPLEQLKQFKEQYQNP